MRHKTIPYVKRVKARGNWYYYFDTGAEKAIEALDKEKLRPEPVSHEGNRTSPLQCRRGQTAGYASLAESLQWRARPPRGAHQRDICQMDDLCAATRAVGTALSP